MAIETTPLWYEVERILNGPYTFNNRRWDAIIHLLNVNMQLVPVRVTHVNIRRKYNSNYTDEVFMECYMPAGDYADIFYPNKMNLEVTLIANPLNTVNGPPPKSFRYKAVVIDAGQPRMVSPDMNGAGTDMLNLTDIFCLQFQLLPKVIYKLRTASCGVIFRNTDAKDAMTTLLTSETSRIEGEANEKIQGIDLITPDNQDKKEQMVIPHGTMLYDVPQFFQQKLFGVYRNGLAHYIQDNHWYVYPKYDFNRQESTDRELTIVVLPRNRFPGINKTYRKTGDYSYTILATAEGQYRNTVKEQTMTEGTGSRFLNAESIMSNTGREAKQNKLELEKPKYLSEITQTVPSDGETFAPFSSEPITSNTFHEQSKLAGRHGAHISFKWENSYPDAIIPGMLVKVIYLTVDNQIKTVRGILLEAEHFEALSRNNLMDDSYKTNTALHIYCENDLKDQHDGSNNGGGQRQQPINAKRSVPQFLFAPEHIKPVGQ